MLAGIILLIVSLVLVDFRKACYALPEVELRRRARAGGRAEGAISRAVAYGSSFKLLLWLVIGVLAAVGLVLLARAIPADWGMLAVFIWLWLAWGLIPQTRLSHLEQGLGALIAPLFVWLLGYVHTPLSKFMGVSRRRLPIARHTGLFEASDLKELIKLQRAQADNRIEESELKLASNALNFGRFKVSDALVPKRQVLRVKMNDAVGPKLLDELYKSGLTSLPVLDSKQPAGVLHLKDVGLKSSGEVKNHVEKTVLYVHEEDSLAAALAVFYRTKSPLFVVINSSEEYVGVLPVEKILERLVGKPASEPVVEPTDPAQVAARAHTLPDDDAVEVAGAEAKSPEMVE